MPSLLIVDDHLLFADVLALAIGGSSAHVQKATNGKAALALASKETFDLVLLDMNLPDMHGERVLTALVTEQPKLSVLVVTASKVDLVRMKSLGARGVIHKSSEMETMKHAIDTVLAGKCFFPEPVSSTSADQPECSVSPRQLEILRAMAGGLSNKSIAHALNISEGTVKQQVNRIFRALDVYSRVQCIQKAQQLGLDINT